MIIVNDHKLWYITELKVGAYDELGDEEESSACDLSSSWLILSLVFPAYYFRSHV